MKNVLIPTKLDTVAATLLEKKGYKVVQDSDKAILDLVQENPDTEAIIVRSEKVTPEIIDALPNLRLVVRAGAGYNTIDTKYARRKNVDVMNTPGANANAVAEEVVTLILAACRHVVKGDVTTRAGEWEKKKLMGTELANKTLGILGLGNIGQLLVKRLQGFDMKFLAYDPFISAERAAQLGVEICCLEDVFSEADFVSLHIPENDETKGMIDKRYLGLMKPGSMLVNCARAGVINEDDLRAIKSERNLVFCNDVYPKDAAGEKSIADIADVMLPHLGASTKEANFNAAKRAAEQIMGYCETGVTTYVVNKGIPDGLDECYQNLAFALSKLARCYLGQDRQPVKIETSFYGDLQEYANWMLSPVTAGISPEFDPFLDASDAESFLKERGIDVVNRQVDDEKAYGKSITIDLFEGTDTINKVSVRGTITENNLMISRLNNFEKLYLEPTGHNLFVEYGDEPGVIGKIASLLGANDINIIDIRAPQDLKRNLSLAVIKTSRPVENGLISEISDSVNASAVFNFSY